VGGSVLEERLGRLRGFLEVWDLPRKGPSRCLYRSENVITDDGRERAAELIFGLSTDPFVYVALGDNGVVPGPPRLLDTAVAPDRTDSALANEIDRKLADSILLSGTVENQVILTTEFLTADGPFPFWNSSEEVVNEYGVFSVDDIMLARRTAPSIPFDVGDRIGLRIIWKFTGL
jgi:hypothetical protein